MITLSDNYVSAKKPVYNPNFKQGEPTRRFDFDLYNDISMRNLSNAKGKLLKSSLLPNPTGIAKDASASLKTFSEALSGKGDDFAIGKTNDTFIRMGSLGIGGLLSIKAMSPFGRAMEFVGFATWFTVMSLWPKYFVGIPVKLTKGFDINQKYIDSQKKVKMFFQDPQYLPFDLFSDKELNKIGDKLKIPRNIKNREEAIQNKMKQIAVQTNTLMILSAGFATPLLSSLIANRLEMPIKKTIHNFKTASAKIKFLTDGYEDFSYKPSGTAEKIFYSKAKFANKLMNLLSPKKADKAEEELIKLLSNPDIGEEEARRIRQIFAAEIKKLGKPNESAGISSAKSNGVIRKEARIKLTGLMENPQKGELIEYYRGIKGIVKSQKLLFDFYHEIMEFQLGEKIDYTNAKIIKELKIPESLLKEIVSDKDKVQNLTENLQKFFVRKKSSEIADAVKNLEKPIGNLVGEADSYKKTYNKFCDEILFKKISEVLPEINGTYSEDKIKKLFLMDGYYKNANIKNTYEIFEKLLKGNNYKSDLEILDKFKDSTLINELIADYSASEKTVRNNLLDLLGDFSKFVDEETIDNINKLIDVDIVTYQKLKAKEKFLPETMQKLKSYIKIEINEENIEKIKKLLKENNKDELNKVLVNTWDGTLGDLKYLLLKPPVTKYAYVPSKEMETLFGQMPQGLIGNSAEKVMKTRNWQKGVLIPFAVLYSLVLAGILLSGRKNSYNPDDYKYKEAQSYAYAG